MSPNARARFAALLIAVLIVAPWSSPVRAEIVRAGVWYPWVPEVAVITRLAVTDAVVHMRLSDIWSDGTRHDLGYWFGVTRTPENRELAAQILDLARTALAERKTVSVLVDTFNLTTRWAEIVGIEIYP